MSKSNLSRRSIVAGAAAVPAAAALSLPAVADTADAELRRLWSKYLDRVAEYDVTDAKHTVVRNARDAKIDAEFPRTSGRLDERSWDARELRWKVLEDQLGLSPLWEAWNETIERVNGIIWEIQRTPAESLFGVGIKLTALPMSSFGSPEKEDWQCGVRATLVDIDRLLGSDFSARIAAEQIEEDA